MYKTSQSSYFTLFPDEPVPDVSRILSLLVVMSNLLDARGLYVSAL